MKYGGNASNLELKFRGGGELVKLVCKTFFPFDLINDHSRIFLCELPQAYVGLCMAKITVQCDKRRVVHQP